MGLVTKTFTFSSGGTIVASQHNTNFDDIINEFNGNIDNNNIKAGAGIVGSKLNLATVGAIGGTSSAGISATNFAASSNTLISGNSTFSAVTVFSSNTNFTSKIGGNPTLTGNVVLSGTLGLPSISCFKAFSSASMGIVSNTVTKANFNTTVGGWDLRGEYDITGNCFRCATPGRYYFNAAATYQVKADSDAIALYLVVGGGGTGTVYAAQKIEAGGASDHLVGVSSLINLTANNTVAVYLINANNNDTFSNITSASWFEGWRVT